MARVIIPSASGEILFVTNQSASLDFRRYSGIRSGSGIIGKWEVDPDDETSVQFRIPKEKIGTSNDRTYSYPAQPPPFTVTRKGTSSLNSSSSLILLKFLAALSVS